MSRTHSPWTSPDRTLARARQVDHEILISDFALMALLPVRSVAVEGFPLNEFAMLTLVCLCLFRAPRGRAALPRLVALVIAALLTLLVYSGVMNDVDWVRRIGHVGIVAALAWALGTGRVSLRSAALGLGVGLTAVIGLALFDIGGDNYPGRLTGYLSDPNAGAYFIVTLGILAVFYSGESWKLRLALAAPIVAGLVLTYSRTGLLAAAFAIVWLAVARHLSEVGAAALALASVWLVANIPDDIKTFGPFSNRTGSDSLRERIVAQQYVQLADMPWYGHGPGTATVEVRNLEFFYHNSFLATRQEGGWLALLLVLLLLAMAFATLSVHTRGGDLVAAAGQAAIISVAAMSITLGEVLLDTPMGIAVGFALGHSAWHRAETDLDA